MQLTRLFRALFRLPPRGFPRDCLRRPSLTPGNNRKNGRHSDPKMRFALRLHLHGLLRVCLRLSPSTSFLRERPHVPGFASDLKSGGSLGTSGSFLRCKEHTTRV